MEPELRDFIINLGCHEAIEKMEQEKLNLTVINYMCDDDLVQFLPKIGDRIALKLFVDEEIKKKQETRSHGKEKKTKLIQTLRTKLGILKTRHCHDSVPADDNAACTSESSLNWRKKAMARHGNRNAFKEGRKVELGWINDGKQVKTAKGGGTRKIALPRNSRKKEVLDKAKAIFFPANHAILGSIVDFTFKLTDFSNREIQDETIEELYESSKLSLLRLYMVTEKKNSSSKLSLLRLYMVTEKKNSVSTESLTLEDQIMILSEPLTKENTTRLPEKLPHGLESFHVPPIKFMNRNPTESDCEQAESILMKCPLHVATTIHVQSKGEFSFEPVPKVTPTQSQPVTDSFVESVESLSTPIHALQHACSTNMCENCQQNTIMAPVVMDSILDLHSYDTEIFFHPGDDHLNTRIELDDTVSLNESVKKVTVKRGHVFYDMMNYFLEANFDPRIDHLQVELVSERGEDAGGVFRDVVSEFWETFYIKHTVGSDIKIPTTVHIMRREHWEAVAKVLICGYKQEGYLPIQLSQVFLQRCIDGKDVQDEKLFDTFLSSLPTMDREIFEMALNDFDSVDEEDLWDVCSSYEARITPTKDSIRKLVRDISHHQIVQKPSFVTECWSPLLQCYLRSLLPNTGLEEVYRDLHVTNKKVLKLLQLPDDILKAEKVTLDSLRQYIKSCSKDKLTAFLRFCTGSDLIIGKQIEVRFTSSMSAFTLRPIAHTCGCVLELSTSYDNFLLLREHFDNILDSKMLRMDII